MATDPRADPHPDSQADSHGAQVERLVREVSLLIRRSRQVARVLAARVHPEVDIGAYAVLLLVRDAGGLRMVDVAEELGLDKSTASRQIAPLLRLGLLERHPDPDDGRAFQLRLSEAGARRLAEVTSERRAAWRERLGTWEAGEVGALADGLQRLVRDLQA